MSGSRFYGPLGFAVPRAATTSEIGISGRKRHWLWPLQIECEPGIGSSMRCSLTRLPRRYSALALGCCPRPQVASRQDHGPGRAPPPSLRKPISATQGHQQPATVVAVQDDQALLGRLRAGDDAAFEALVARHDRALRRVARTFVRTPAAADDVVQETWLAVIRGLDRFEGRSSLSTWIFRILANRARTRATRDARSVPFSALEDNDRPAVDPSAFGADGRWRSTPPRLESDPEASALSSELRTHLLAAVDDLAPAQRAVITLRDLVGLNAEDVCSLLEINDGNQRVLLQ